MEHHIKEALEIVKAQASLRSMTEEEISSMVRKLANGIRNITESLPDGNETKIPAVDPAKAIKEKSITCLECGKVFKVLTRKHLAACGLTPDEYRAKWNMKKGAALVCKSLQRERRKKMKDMRLWERRMKKA